jgi:hypothetical protein
MKKVDDNCNKLTINYSLEKQDIKITTDDKLGSELEEGESRDRHKKKRDKKSNKKKKDKKEKKRKRRRSISSSKSDI